MPPRRAAAAAADGSKKRPPAAAAQPAARRQKKAATGGLLASAAAVLPKGRRAVTGHRARPGLDGYDRRVRGLQKAALLPERRAGGVEDEQDGGWEGVRGAGGLALGEQGYYDQGGWSGYTWDGVERECFVFSDSLQVGGSLQVGDNEGWISEGWSKADMARELSNKPATGIRYVNTK